MSIQLNPPRAALVDANGMVTAEWYRFFISLLQVVGGPSNPIDDSTLFSMATPQAVSFAQSGDQFSPPQAPVALDDPLIPPAMPVVSDDLLYPPRYGV